MACAWLEHISLRVVAIRLVRAKKLVSVEDTPSGTIRGEDKYPCRLMHGLRFDGKLI